MWWMKSGLVARSAAARYESAGTGAPARVRNALRPPLPDPLLDRLERHFTGELFATEPACRRFAAEA